jgi:hypothetical protein
MVAARRVDTLKVCTKLVDVGFHRELHCMLSTVTADMDSQVMQDETKVMTLELAK